MIRARTVGEWRDIDGLRVWWVTVLPPEGDR